MKALATLTLALAPTVRELASTFPSTTGMWTVPLRAVGGTEVTHYISAGLIGADFADLLDNPDALAEAASVPVEQINALLSVCDVSAEYVADAMDRLGLRLVQPDEPI